MTVFILVFCISGIILNHRDLFSEYSVSRSLLPSSYSIKDYNNGVIKGTMPLDSTRLLAYGNCGVFLTDREFSGFKDLNAGFPKGVDSRNVRNIVRTRDGRIWCAARSGLYTLQGDQWQKTELPENNEDVTDVTLAGDSCSVVALTRSAAYIPDSTTGSFKRIMIPAPRDYKDKETLFKTVWRLHSGEFFGMPGRIAVDIIAIILAFLCVTGIIVFFLPYSIRRRKNVKKTGMIKTLGWNLKWHNKLGYWTIVLTIFVAFTGMCLRPPLMVPLVMAKTSTGADNGRKNVWNDRLRGIRWDNTTGKWLLSTSIGFASADKDFKNPTVLADSRTTPPVSPMGITVFEQTAPDEWLVGSFSGLYRWNPGKSEVTDFFTGKKGTGRGGGRPVSVNLVSGYSKDLSKDTHVVFDYSKGAAGLPETLEILSRQPLSLWNFALELHVGRCYHPFLGPVSDLFVFLSGLILILILVSGLIIMHRKKRQATKSAPGEQMKCKQ